MKTLEFCIPAVEDYGAALKGNNWDAFKRCYDQLMLFFACCSSKGTADYQRSMHTYFLMLEYWSAKQLPVMAMMKQNPTFFSEESGEIAISMLVNMQPLGTGANIEVARRYWQCLHLRERTFSVLDTPRTRNK